MRRNIRSAKGDVIIDLTPLLDVMFIILIVVLYGQKTTAADIQSKAEEAISQAEEEKKLYEEQQEMFNNIWTVSITVPYDEKEIEKRHINILEKEKEIYSFELVGYDMDNTRDKFKNYLVDYIKQKGDKPVYLSLNEDDDCILYRDEMMVNDIFDELLETYRNVYVIKGNSSEETK